MVQINLPDSYIISNRVKSLSEDEIVTLINIGEYIFFNGHSVYKTNENEKFTFAYNKQIEEIRLQSDKQIKNHADIITSQLNMIIKGKDNLIESKHNEMIELKIRIKTLESENCQALSLSGKLDSLMGKGNTVDNAMKGDFGESIVANQIQHWYQASEIEDKSADTAKGDLLWKLNDGEFRALVEVKNVQMVRPIEIQKFERDMIINIKDNSCNCGLFVSLKTETIPNKGKFKLEFINNCPIIYVCNILEDLQTLRFALDALCCIQHKLKYFNIKDDIPDNSEVNLQELIVEFVQKQFLKLDSLRLNISQMRLAIDTLSNCIDNEEKISRDLMNNIVLLKSEHDMFKQIEQDYKTNSREELKESILRDMRAFETENNRKPTLHDLTHKYKVSIFKDDLAFKKLKKEMA